MNKCFICGKDTNYQVCYDHRNESYLDTCKIHGRQLFVKGKCGKCKNDRRSLYRINKRGSEYYIGTSRKPISKNSYLYKELSTLLNKNEKYHRERVKNLKDSAGIYGIFKRDRRYKKGIGNCLYVGQSTELKRRKEEHKNNIRLAKKNKGLDSKYYKLHNIGISNLKFVPLIQFKREYIYSLSKEERNTLLTLYEQLFMDIFKPSLNYFAARPTRR